VQSLIDELEFNASLADQVRVGVELLPSLHLDQFKMAVAAGAISALRDEIKTAVLQAYGAAERANAAARKRDAVLAGTAGRSLSGSGSYYGEAETVYGEAGALARAAMDALLRFLSTEPDEGSAEPE
jgi:hypothetical protein